MSIFDFYPFRTRPGSIQLHLIPAQEQVRSSSDGSLLIYELDSSPVSINARIEVPHSIFSDVLDASENEDRPVRVILRYKSIESRRRISVGFNGGNGNECLLEFERDDWRGAVTFQACLIRSTDNPDLPDGYASKAGAILAWSEPARVLFDEPRMPPGDFLRIVWKDFAQSEDWLRQQSNHLFALDTSADTPVVVLNQGVPNAYQVLSNRASSGRIAQIRDATFFLIVHQVWSSLIAEALVNISAARMGDEENIDLILDELPGWQQALIVDWAPKLYTEEDADESLPRLVSSIRGRGAGDWSRDLIYRRLPEAIQRQYRTWRGFRGLVQEVGIP